MALSVFTNEKIIILNDDEATMFMHHILTPDEKNEVQPMQQYNNTLISKVHGMPLKSGVTEDTKKRILQGFASLLEGHSFLCTPAIIENKESREAKYYLNIVSLMNDGQNRTAAQAQAVARREADEQTIVSKEHE
jgi:hypothetical protein